MIFDLNSTGGTFVNGKRVTQSMLYPGDVISLAGVPLIYGQETSVVGDTQELLPPQDLKDNDKA
jgi:pSer/pThr/pTyr-binding forkhead associated (FHA) protein